MAGPFPGSGNGSQPIYTTSQSGFGEGLNLTANGFVSFATPPTSFTQATGGSIDVWVKTTDGGLDIAVSGTPSGSNWYFGLSSGHAIFAYNVLTEDITSSATFNDGNWHLLSINIAAGASGLATLYVDGTSVGTGNMPASYTMQITELGGYNGGFEAIMEIDEVRLTGAPLYLGDFTPPSAPYANSAPNQIALWHLDGNLYDSNTAYVSLTPGAVGRASVTTTSQVLSQGQAEGGTAPYSYQLQRTTHGGSSWANVGSASAYTSATPPNVTDSGLEDNTTYDYRSLIVDSEGSPATAAGSTSSFATKDPKGLYVGFIGDSITLGLGLTTGQDPPASESRQLGNWNGVRTTIFVNEGINSTTTESWAPTGSNYLNAVAAFESYGVSVVSIMLGTNDANSSNNFTLTEYTTNLTAIVDALVTAGYVVVLNQPPYPQPSFGSVNLALLQSYFPAIEALCNGSTVILGDTAAYSVFEANFNAYAPGDQGSYYQEVDDVHPNEFGAQVLGAALWGYPQSVYFGVAGSSSGNSPNGFLSLAG